MRPSTASIAAALLLAVAACGTPRAEEAPSATNPDAPVTVAEPVAEPIKIVFEPPFTGPYVDIDTPVVTTAPQPHPVRRLTTSDRVLVTATDWGLHDDRETEGTRPFRLLVVDAVTEAVVPDAEIRFFRVSDRGPDWRQQLPARLYADETGTVNVDVALDARVAMVARAPECLPVTAILDPLAGVRTREGLLGRGLVVGPSGESATLFVGGGGRLHGVVTDEDGLPLADAVVRISPPDETQRQPWRHGYLVDADAKRFLSPMCTTDAEGAYDLRGVAVPGRYVVLAGRAHDATGRSAETLFLPETDEACADVRLEPRSMLIVRVMDADETPQPEAWIELQATWGPKTPDVSDGAATGEWRYGPLLAGEYRMSVNAPDLVGERRVVTVDGLRESTQTFLLNRGGALTGRLTNPSGTPISGVEVRFTNRSSRHSAKSDDDGRFSIPGVSADPGTVQIFTPPGHRSYLRRKVVPTGDPLEITLEPLSSIRGRVLPVPACGTVTYSGPGGSRTGWKTREIAVDDDGTFLIDGIDGVRAFDMLLWPGGGACHILRGTKLTSGKTLDIGTIDGSPEARLTGHVVDENGEPLPGATVFLEQFPVAQRVRTRTDADGSFTLPLNARGDGLLVVKADGLPTTHVPLAVDPDRRRVSLQVLPGGTVAGTLPTTGSGRQSSYIEFRRKAGPGRWVANATAGLGLYEVRLPAGTYTTRGRINGKWVAGDEVEVRSGGKHVVSIKAR